MSDTYLAFLKAKACIAVARGIEVRDDEINPGYFLDGALHCAAAEERIAIPSLFDLMDAERPDAPALEAAE